MRVLLCTPYETGSRIASGGITMWARNIMDYYKMSKGSSLIVDVQPFDRNTFINENTSLLRRILSGIKEYLHNVYKASNSLKRNRYDVVHLNTSASLGLLKDLVMIMVAHRHGARIVLHFHFGRIPQLMEQNNWESKLLKSVLKRADSVITMDNKSFAKLKELGCGNVFYLPNPLSLNIIHQISGIKESVNIIPRSILFVGHVIKSKGVFELVEATRGLNNSTLKIIGKYSEETKKQLLSINKDVTLCGEMQHELVIKEMLSADIFVLPSYTEGFPNVILESMACGCTIVGTSVGAIPEMLGMDEQQPSGIVIPAKNTCLLHNVLDILLNDDKSRLLYKERAVNRVNTLYAIDVVWKDLTDIWKKCCLTCNS